MPTGPLTIYALLAICIMPQLIGGDLADNKPLRPIT